MQTDRHRVDVDVVIVHYATVDTQLKDLIRCLDTVEPAEPASVTIVNNASPLDLPLGIATRPDLDVVRLPNNVGFGAGANVGARRHRAKYVLFLNPDVSLRSVETLPTLLHALEQSANIVAVAPQLLLPSARAQVGAAGYFPTCSAVLTHAFPFVRWLPVDWSKRPMFLSQDHTRNLGMDSLLVDWVSGACLLVKRGHFERVGGFDERFFMYAEDIDLCARFAQRGWRVCYCPSASVTHDHRPRSTGWLIGLDQYYRIHSPRSRRLLHGILASGMVARSLACALRITRRSDQEQTAKQFASYAWQAVRLAIC